MSRARDLASIFNLSPLSGTTAERPSTAPIGQLYYNGTTAKTQIYTSTGWQDMASGIAYGNNSARPSSPAIGTPYFNGEAARLELYTANGWQNIVQETPGISSVQGNVTDTATSNTIVVSGTNFFEGATVSLIGTNGVEIQPSSTTVNSTGQITAVFGPISATHEPYDVKVLNVSNLYGLLSDGVFVNQTPVWNTASGSLGLIYDSARDTTSFTVSASDPEGTAISYSVFSGALPTGMTISSASGIISGTASAVATDTTYNFTLRASDGVNVSNRAFSILSKAPVKSVFSHTGSHQVFSIPAGITRLKAKIWGAAGGEYNANTNLTNSGGAGGYTETTFNVLNGETTLTIIVGGGLVGNTMAAYGGGGGGVNGGTGGGGCSAILSGNISAPFVQQTTGLSNTFVPQQSLLSLTGAIGVIAVAGGGGGAGWYETNNQVGGNGGGVIGRNGSGYTTTIGGTQSSSTNGNNTGGAGKFKGGYIVTNNSGGGSGGGGGGWFGGGAAQGASGQNASGAGGSGFVGYTDGSTSVTLSANQADSVSYIDVITRTNGSRTYTGSKCLASAAGTFTPPNTSDVDYTGDVGVATYYPGNDGTSKSSGHGLVVISY
jgi:hypothetical protein